ncbi:mutator type transposase, partial [Tanacetum coccineum]
MVVVEWKICDYEDPVDKQEAYSKYDETLYLLKIHHGGFFTEPPGYKNKKNKMYYHFKIPNNNLDHSLQALGNDADVINLVRYMDKYKLIEVFIEHEYTVLETYFKSPQKLRLEEIDDGPSLNNDVEVPSFNVEKEKETIDYAVSESNEEDANEDENGSKSNEEAANEDKTGSESSESSKSDDSEDSDNIVDEDNVINEVDVDMQEFYQNINKDVECVGPSKGNLEVPAQVDVEEGYDLDDFDMDIDCDSDVESKATALVTCQAVATRRQLYVWKNEKIEDIVKPNPSIPVKALKEHLQKKYQVGISIGKVKRARAVSIMKVKGNFSEQYSLLMDYVLEPQRTNEDTTMKIDLEREYNLRFKEWLRDLLGLDGCFIKAQYPGQRLTAVGIDANHGIYPVAYAIMETKNTSSWVSFLKDNQFRELVWKCAAATTVPYFDKQIGKLKNLDEGRAHCDVLLNYLCEVFNRQLLDGRDVPIITCLEFVRDYLMKRIVNVKKVISKSPGPLTPAAIKLFEAIKYKATFYK